MESSKIAISIDKDLLKQLDHLVSRRKYPNRSRAISQAVRAELDRINRVRLARESAKLSPRAEQEMADEGLSEDQHEWPEY